jgi:hypothetical protein
MIGEKYLDGTDLPAQSQGKVIDESNRQTPEPRTFGTTLGKMLRSS